MRVTISTFVLCLCLFYGCKKDAVTPTISIKPNILFIIADDMGLDACAGYDIGSVKPQMPTIQSLASTGIRFSNLWSNPTCTPTRAGVITGKYGFRTQVLEVGNDLSTSETSLQQYIEMKTGSAYSNAVVGKWHLSSNPNHPGLMGVDYFAGLLSGGVQSYWNWSLTENGQTSISTEYTTTKFTDLAINWIENQNQPWFLWLAYNAPHTPFHLPPDSLHSQGVLPTDQASIDANPTPYYMAMIEAMDTEIGRLLNSLSEEERHNTVIIFIGDNGTPSQVAQEYNNKRVKGTVFQGGVNVPMIISGKNVTRLNQMEDALLNTTDLFATIAEIAGSNTTKINDSKSFNSLLSMSGSTTRDFTYTEVGHAPDNPDITIRNNTHKYILFSDGKESLFDLNDNPFEKPDLLSANQLPLSPADSTMKFELLEKLDELTP